MERTYNRASNDVKTTGARSPSLQVSHFLTGVGECNLAPIGVRSHCNTCNEILLLVCAALQYVAWRILLQHLLTYQTNKSRFTWFNLNMIFNSKFFLMTLIKKNNMPMFNFNVRV